MILYYYEHCPYCLRVRAFSGLKKISLLLRLMAFADIETPVSLCGKKQAPILQKDDGSIMVESTDIIAYLDAFEGNRIIETYTCDPDLEACLNHLSNLHLSLTSPLYINLKGIEFDGQADQDRYLKREEQHIGMNFETVLLKSAFLKQEMQKQLQETLLPVIEQKQLLEGSGTLFSKVVLFVFLRKLSLVNGLVFPKTLALFFKDYTQKTGLASMNEVL